MIAGDTISHYRILKKLGAGGMGEVWLAEDIRLKRRVALKLLPAQLTQDADRVRRFEQEAQAASALSHPNIIAIHDIGESDAGRFIVMELVSGRTLRSVIDSGSTTNSLLDLGSQIAKALSAAHSAGITHRDIKPDNIMVREDGYVKVLDFGLARLINANASGEDAATMVQQTLPGTVMGTVAYMSPEQARGETAGSPSDIFALGIVLYELATGRHPFKSESLVGYLHAITLQTPEPLTNIKPDLPASLSDLILKMLNKDAGQRPTAGELVSCLQGASLDQNVRSVGSSDNSTVVLPPSASSNSGQAGDGFWVAVLPFRTRGGNAELEDLAEGLSEDIVTGLSRFSYLRVISRGSVLKGATASSDSRELGQRLGARYLIEGNLRLSGGRLRLAVQLIDGQTGENLWAESYDRAFRPEDTLDLQDELVPPIVSTVADQYGALVRHMSDSVRRVGSQTFNPHEAVLRGFSYWERATPEEHLAAREMLEAAVAAEPNHGGCLAMLSTIYFHEYAHGYNTGTDPVGRAYAMAQRAIAVAPDNHLAHSALATALFAQKDFRAMRPVAEKALALNSLDASTTALIGFLFAYSGDWAYGMSLVEKAIALNPNHPAWYHLPAFYNSYRSGNYQQASEISLRINVPGYYWPQVTRAAAFGQLGEQERAGHALAELHKLRPDFSERAREEFGVWFDAELTEHLIQGLRKAGMTIRDKSQGLSQEPAVSKTKSIAVLPFANISADEENEYFCDGLAEELLNGLAKIEELKVAARTSAFSFKGKHVEAREIGKALGVNTVLEGSVRKAGNRIRINVQLVNAADGYQLWSERYDREMKDIFDVQDEITLAVVEALKVQLLGGKKEAVLKRHTRNPNAHEHYLRGLYFFNRFTPDDFQRAIEYFNRAIAIDDQYASAFAGLAIAYVEIAFFTFSAPGEWMPKAQEAITTALALDGTLGDAHNSLAIIKMYYNLDFPGAEREFLQAMALDGGNPHVHMWYGWYLGLMGRFEESAPVYQRAIELDPLSEVINSGVGITSYWAGKSEQAIQQLHKVLELNPHYLIARSFLAESYVQSGDFAAAKTAIEGLRVVADNPLTLPAIGYVYGKIGDSHGALGVLAELELRAKRESVSPINFAQVYAGLGDTERTLACLEKACSERPLGTAFMKVDPKFAFLRSDPRFQALLVQMGFPA